MKNFKVVTEKTSTSRKAKAREFFSNLDEREKSTRCFVICGIFSASILLGIIIAIVYAAEIIWEQAAN